jgi:hypothetical protein
MDEKAYVAMFPELAEMETAAEHRERAEHLQAFVDWCVESWLTHHDPATALKNARAMEPHAVELQRMLDTYLGRRP